MKNYSEFLIDEEFFNLIEFLIDELFFNRVPTLQMSPHMSLFSLTHRRWRQDFFIDNVQLVNTLTVTEDQRERR